MKGNNNSLDGIKNVTIYTPEGINHILRKIDTEQNIFNMKNEYIRYSKKEIECALKGIGEDLTVEEIIKLGLKNLAR